MFLMFKLARSIVNGIISTIMKLMNQVQDAVTAPIRTWTQRVTGGIWKGDGAVRFVNEMTQEIIPQLVSIGSLNMNFGNSIKKCIDLIDQADKRALGRVNQLDEIFGNIFKG
jgi:hypothetical protein